MIDDRISRRSTLKIAGLTTASLALPSCSLLRRGGSGDVDVLILGAGMAGLHAARLIENAGHSVQVIEGSPRVGGRCWTQRDIQGRPELGAQQIGFGYGRVRGNASDLGVELVDPPKGASAETRLPPLAVSVGGAIPPMDWATSPTNRLSPSERSMIPLRLLSYYLLKDNPLKDLRDWQKPEFRAIDQQSMRQYLASKGASPEALRMIDVTIAAESLDDANALDFLRKQYYYAWEEQHGTFHVVKDGTDALTTAMAKSLKRPVLLKHIVAHIDSRPDGVVVTFKDGSTVSARTCISTIPPKVLRDIPISGGFPDAQRAALGAQRSVGNMQIFLKLDAPFWETDGLPATMWTDGPAEIFVHTPSLVDPIGAYYVGINGAGCTRLAGLSDQALGELALAELFKRRPAAKGHVSVSYIHRWATYPFAKGHIAYFAPGDIATHADIVGQPLGRLHFAGEHLCRIHAGIEGACESAENAALAVLDQLDKG